MLGLFAFFYAALHFTTWIGLDQGVLWPYILPEAGPDEAVTWELILRDIAKRPYITVGFTGFVLMIPLAITSTAGWIRRLGGRWWNRLHRLVYVTGICGVVHFLWLVKVVEAEQITYAVILAVLLGLRALVGHRQASRRHARARSPDGQLARLVLRRHVQFRSFDRTPRPGRSRPAEVPIEEAVLHDAEPPAIPFIA